MPRAEGKTAKKAAAKPKPAEQEQETLDVDSTDDWFAPIDDVVDTTNTLLYGREGSGKSTAAARLVNSKPNGRLLVINAEGGLKKGPLVKRGVDTSRIVVWPDPRKGQRVDHISLDEVHRKVKADLMKDPESWIGVVMDSATEVFTAFLDNVQKERVKRVQQRGVEVDVDHVDISDYGTMSKQFRDLLRKFRDLPCHFVVTALERRDVDKDTGKPQYGPAVTPGLQSDLLGYVDFVLMCRAEDEAGPFRALTRANSRYRAKDRYDILPKVMVDPYMDRLLGYVAGDLTPETDQEQDRIAAAASAQDAPVKGDDDEPDDSPDED